MHTPEDIGIQIQRRLLGMIEPDPSAVLPPASWRVRVASRLDWLAARLRGDEVTPGKTGKLLRFIKVSRSLGRHVYSVQSVRGGMEMGTLEWSNQWQRPRFKADPEAVFDQQCVAEIYAMMKEFK